MHHSDKLYPLLMTELAVPLFSSPLPGMDAAVVVKTGKGEEAIRHLEHWDQIVRKLEVGVYLRNFAVSPEQSKAAEDLREAVGAVRDELLAGNADAANQKFKAEVDPAYKACKAAYPD